MDPVRCSISKKWENVPPSKKSVARFVDNLRHPANLSPCWGCRLVPGNGLTPAACGFDSGHLHAFLSRLTVRATSVSFPRWTPRRFPGWHRVRNAGQGNEGSSQDRRAEISSPASALQVACFSASPTTICHPIPHEKRERKKTSGRHAFVFHPFRCRGGAVALEATGRIHRTRWAGAGTGIRFLGVCSPRGSLGPTCRFPFRPTSTIWHTGPKRHRCL